MFKTTWLTTLIVFLFISSVSYSQDKIIDSLKIVLQNPKLHDTTKLRAISETMGNNYSLDDPNYYYLNGIMEKLALKNYHKNNSQELKETYAEYLGEVYSSSAIGEERKRNFIKAFNYIDKSIALYKQAKSYENMNFAIVTKGTLYSDIQEYEKALECMFIPLKYFENSKEKNSASGVCYVQTYLGQIYLKQKKYEKAIEYYKKINQYYERLPKMTPQDMHEQSYIYGNMGSCYASLKKYTEAIANYKESTALAKKIGDWPTEVNISGKIANVKMKQLKYDEAEKILKETLKSEFHPVTTTANYLNLGELYYEKKDYAQATIYLNKGVSLSKEYDQFELLKEGSNLLYKVSLAKNDYKNALDMYELHNKLVDSSQTETSKNALAQQQLKYDFEKKELKTKLTLEKKTAVKNNWIIGLWSLLLLILVGAYFYYRNSKQKQAITLLEKDQIKQKLLVTQMNPHFIFNSIDNIQGLIQDKQDKEAVSYLTKFSKLTRQILENSNENYISLSEEVEMTQNYLAIQQLLYNNKFSYTISIEDAIDAEAIFLPPMLTQPFIENAIKHGLSNKSENGMIAIDFYLKEAKLFFEVTDNGKGFETDKKLTNHKSLAMTITKERLISYTKNQDFVVQTDNIFDQNTNIVGAKVIFEIPYIYEN